MSNLVERTEKLLKKTDEVMNEIMKASGVHAIKTMGDDELVFFRDFLNLVDEFKEYCLEVSKELDKIDSIERKLNSIDNNINRLLQMKE